MLSLKNHNNEKPIITITNKDNKKVGEVFLFSNKNKDLEGFSEMELEDNHKFQLIPDMNKNRDCIYVAGQSGSGKSFFCKEYLKEYIKLHPKNDLYLFSYLDEDETIDQIKKLQRFDINDKEFMNEELDPKDFKNCCIVLDDIEMISDKKLKNKILDFFKKLLQVGRHYNTTVVFACHEVCNGSETKTVLNECHSVTIFPKVYGNKKLHYLLDNYFGLDKNQIERIKNLDSRAVTIIRSYPKVCVSEHEIFLI
jgi:hypothetical protein